MFFLILSTIGSAMISVVMRLSKSRIHTTYSMLCFNYVFCTLLSLIHSGSTGIIVDSPMMPRTAALGLINGAVYLASLIAMHRCISKNGIVLPAIYSKVSLIIPLVIACAAFGEVPTAIQLTGCALAFVAILLMNYEPGTGFDFNKGLLFLFFIDGIVSSMSKIYEQVGAVELQSQFLFFTFCAAMLMCLVLVIKNKEHPSFSEVLFGAAIGIPNFYSSRFLLTALGSVPAMIAYPLRAVGSIILITLVGVICFKEKLNRQKLAALMLIIMVMILMNI